jgi:hypothetical protein
LTWLIAAGSCVLAGLILLLTIGKVIVFGFSFFVTSEWDIFKRFALPPIYDSAISSSPAVGAGGGRRSIWSVRTPARAPIAFLVKCWRLSQALSMACGASSSWRLSCAGQSSPSALTIGPAGRRHLPGCRSGDLLTGDVILAI